jgi:threonyl-tRNA synthetase
VVGDREEENSAVSVRSRGEGDLGEMALTDFAARVETETEQRQSS